MSELFTEDLASIRNSAAEGNRATYKGLSMLLTSLIASYGNLQQGVILLDNRPSVELVMAVMC